jgi:hypothetical protein
LAVIACGGLNSVPVNSTRDTASLRLELAPVGIRRAGHGFFWIGLCFCAGVAVIGAAMLILPHVGGVHKGVYVPPSGQPLPWPAWVIMGAFAAVSIAALLAGIHMGISRASIEVRERALRVESRGLLGTRRRSWRSGEIAAIAARATGLSVGGTKKRGGVSRSGVHGKSIVALYIDLTSGSSVRLLSGRDGDELDAVAAQLREAVGCGDGESDN